MNGCHGAFGKQPVIEGSSLNPIKIWTDLLGVSIPSENT